jgi:hypothetical protein
VASEAKAKNLAMSGDSKSTSVVRQERLSQVIFDS